MNFGDSVPDASRSGPDDGTVPGAAGGDGDGHQARSLRTQKPLQDIQDLIDKLAAVTQQLRHPRPPVPAAALPCQVPRARPRGPAAAARCRRG